VRQWRPLLAEKLRRPANLLSTLLNVMLLAIILTVQFDMLTSIPLRAFAGMSLLLLATVGIGWLLGGPGADHRKTMAIMTSVRNAGVTLVIVASSFPGTRAVTAATAYALVQTIAMALIAIGWGRLASATAATTSPATLGGPASKGIAS
jgi:BASS family bile acid:Na+ symporter